MSLYQDNHPKTSLKGTGYKDEKKALATIEKIKNKNIIYQFQIINTMYNRAKYHPNKTIDMKKAMKIFKIWLKEYKKRF